jgi:uncharacterized RDD family membrane protein YckC
MADKLDRRAPPARKGATSSTAHNPARLRVRLVAAGIDLLVVLVVAMTLRQPQPLIVIIGIFVAYHATLTWWLGRTIGKALVGLRVLRPGRKVTLWWSLARAGPGYLLGPEEPV